MRWLRRRPRWLGRRSQDEVEEIAAEAAGPRVSEHGVESSAGVLAWEDLRAVEYECGGWNTDDGIWVEPWVWFHGEDGAFVTLRFEQLPTYVYGALARLPGFPLAEFLQLGADHEIGKRVVVWERPEAAGPA